MIFAVCNAEKEKGNEDHAWLKRAYDYAVRDYQMWLRPELLAGDAGLSRYFDFGEGGPPRLWLDQGGPHMDFLAELPAAKRAELMRVH
jgi:alpha,alpha-trehalase